MELHPLLSTTAHLIMHPQPYDVPCHHRCQLPLPLTMTHPQHPLACHVTNNDTTTTTLSCPTSPTITTTTMTPLPPSCMPHHQQQQQQQHCHHCHPLTCHIINNNATPTNHITNNDQCLEVQSSPVFSFLGHGLRLRPVHQSPNRSKNRTGPLRTSFLRSWTSLDQFPVLTSLNQFMTGFLT